MFRPEPLDIVVIIFVALLVFGANRLPETARAIGQSMREFRKALTEKEESTPAKAAPKVSARPEPTTAEPIPQGSINPDKSEETKTADSV